MLPSTSPREVLLACPSSLLCNLPSFTVESNAPFLSMLLLLSPLPCQGVALAHLDSFPLYHLVLWTDRSVPFPFGKGRSGILANCSLCGTKATFFFQQAQYVQVFLLKSAPFCTVFAGLSSTNKSATSLRLLSDSGSVLATLSSPHLFLYLNYSGRNCFLSPPVLSDYNGSPDTHFSWGTMQLMGGPNGEHYSCPLQSLVVSILFISHIHSLFSSEWRHTVKFKFFDTQVPLIFSEEPVLPRHAHCVLSHLCCNEHSSYLSRIGRIEKSS